MPKPVVTIERWGVVRSVISPTYDKLQPGNHLTGHVFDNANFRHKFRRITIVYTSRITRVDFSQGVVETLNTMYRLGVPSDDYKSWVNKRMVAAA